MVECRMHAIHWGKQQNFAVFFFMVFFLSAHGVKGSRDIEAQFAYILAVLAVQAYTLISHCMLKSLSGCYFFIRRHLLVDNCKVSSFSGPCN